MPIRLDLVQMVRFVRFDQQLMINVVRIGVTLSDDAKQNISSIHLKQGPPVPPPRPPYFPIYALSNFIELYIPLLSLSTDHPMICAYDPLT